MSDVLLQADRVSVRFGNVPILQHVSVSLAAGEIVALIGPNGSGKSTFIRAMLGLIPSDGSILWEDKSIASWSRRALARRVAYLPQSPMHEPGQTVRDVLRMGRAPYWTGFGLENERDGAVVDEVFARLQLDDRPMDSLSGGQRQRVYVGRCLVQEPVALLLDEPDTFLDLKHAVAMNRELHSLARERNIGVLMTSHDLNAAAAFADRMCLLHDGVVVASGTADDVMRADLVSRVFDVELERIDREGKSPLLFPAKL